MRTLWQISRLVLWLVPLVCAQGQTLVVETRDGNSHAHPIKDIVAIRFDYLVGISDRDISPQVPQALVLRQNYPNPFNPSTTIEFEIPRKGKVVVEVFNVVGSRVRTIENAELEIGMHRVTWNGDNDRGRPLASGLYFCRVMFENTLYINKMILMK